MNYCFYCHNTHLMGNVCTCLCHEKEMELQAHPAYDYGFEMGIRASRGTGKIPLPDTQAEQSGHEYLLTENLRAAILLAEMREIPTRVTLARWRQLVEHAASTTAHTDLKEKGGDAT